MLNDQIGRCATIARRHGTDWFVGSINPAGTDLALALKFLEPGARYTATIYGDGDPSDANSKTVKIETVPVNSATVLHPRMATNGGYAVRIIKQ